MPESGVVDPPPEPTEWAFSVSEQIHASFDAGQFRRPVVSAWLNFYVQAHLSADAQRLLVVYQRRMLSNLKHTLRPLVQDRCGDDAAMLAALIDGLYIRAALGDGPVDPETSARAVFDLAEMLIAQPGREV